MANLFARRFAGQELDVTETNADYAARLPQWRKVRDVLEGEDRVRDRGTEYVPKPKGMTARDYRNYLARGSFYGIADRTLRGLTGLVFRVMPSIKVPRALAPVVTFLTPEGFTAPQTLRESVREVLSLGRYGVLVDMAPELTLTPAPYLATYKAEDIINWEELITPGRREVVRVVVREEPATANEKTRTVLRELLLLPVGQLAEANRLLVPATFDRPAVYAMRIWEEVESERETTPVFGRTTRDQVEILSGSFQLVDERIPLRAGRPLDHIPFWFVNPYDHRPRTDKPPMLDLANTNLAHWRNSVDYEHSLFLTTQATPYIFGVQPENVPKAIGGGNIWHSTNPEAKAGVLEIEGKGIEAERKAMLDKEERMAAQGARLIRDFSETANITAETARLQTRGETSVLLAAVESVAEAFTNALKFAATWAAANPGEVELTINRDFIETRMSPQELTALVAGWQSGAYSRLTLHRNLQRGEIVDPDRTVEEEVAALEAEEGIAPDTEGMIGRAVADFMARREGGNEA